MLLRSISRRDYKSLKSRESGADALYEFGGIGRSPGWEPHGAAGGFGNAGATGGFGGVAVLMFLRWWFLLLLLGVYYGFGCACVF